MNFIHSIKFRFTLWYLAILSVLLVLLAGGVYGTLSRTLHHNFDKSLRDRAEQLAGFKGIIPIVDQGMFEGEIGELVSFYYYDNEQLKQISHMGLDVSVDQILIDQAIGDVSSFATIQTARNIGLRIYVSPFTPRKPVPRPDIFPRPDRPRESDRRTRGDRGDRFDRPERPREHDRPPPLRGAQPERPDLNDSPPPAIAKAALVIGRPIGDIEIALERLLRILFWAVPLTILLAGGGGLFLARRVFKPVEKITETARDIEGSDLSRRIEVKTKDELGRLATTLNQMIARLESAFNRQKEFTGDASHELRAPLAVIQAEATLSLQKQREGEEYRKALENIARESEHMATIINQLLTLARADAGKEQLEFAPINLAAFVRDLCVDVEIVCREKDLTLQLAPFDEVSVNGDLRSLRNLFHNLLDNAIKYTSAGGTVSVSVYRDDGQAVVSITDTGIGIPADDQPQIFERFYRVDKARSRSMGGSGLGLAICRHIVTAHSGSIEVESEVGKGSVFSVRLLMV